MKRAYLILLLLPLQVLAADSTEIVSLAKQVDFSEGLESFSCGMWSESGPREDAFGGQSRTFKGKFSLRDSGDSSASVMDEAKAAIDSHGHDIRWKEVDGTWVGTYSFGKFLGEVQLTVEENAHGGEWFLSAKFLEATRGQMQLRKTAHEVGAEIAQEIISERYKELRTQCLAYYDSLPKNREVVAFFQRNPHLKDKVQLMALTSIERERHQTTIDAEASYSLMVQNGLSRDEAKRRMNSLIKDMNEYWDELKGMIPVDAHLYAVRFVSEDRMSEGFLALDNDATVVDRTGSMALRPEFRIK